MTSRLLIAGCLATLVTALPFAASGPLDPQINDKIRQEETAHSQVMRTLHVLSDVYGPRLTGSPNHKAAAEWAVKQMSDWGFTNGHLEPWEFGHPGWSNEHLEVHMTAPVHDALVVEALAWTPGTNGTVTAKAFNLVAPEGPAAASRRSPNSRAWRTTYGPTQAELDAYLASVKDRVRGAAVLVGKPAFVPVDLDAVDRPADGSAGALPIRPDTGRRPGLPGSGTRTIWGAAAVALSPTGA